MQAYMNAKKAKENAEWQADYFARHENYPLKMFNKYFGLITELFYAVFADLMGFFWKGFFDEAALDASRTAASSSAVPSFAGFLPFAPKVYN